MFEFLIILFIIELNALNGIYEIQSFSCYWKAAFYSYRKIFEGRENLHSRK